MLVLLTLQVSATSKPIVVDQNGKGDFTSIQAAINSLSDQATEHRVILIKKGVYQEKVFIEKNFVASIGEDKSKTIIAISQARDIWRCEHPDDWGVATLNLKGSDIVLENLTISNDFGFNLQEDMHIDCKSDSANPSKVVKKSGHQMALRSFGTTRLIARNCVFKAFGGDTVSPWNTTEGQFYFKDCEMEGGVDFYCPRGWAYAENCLFKAHGNTAAIWHDGSANKDSKTVLKNCVFMGEDGFKLGRYHRDAQFYLLNCQFAKNMADAPIYLNASQPQNQIQWGRRIYFYNCHKDGGDYGWLANNLTEAGTDLVAKDLNADWVFHGSWKPESISFVKSKPAFSVVPAVYKTAPSPQQPSIDSIAEKMLLYQRAVGGWPKAVNELKLDYQKPITIAQAKAVLADSMHLDATFDNEATSREIKYLMTAYVKTGNGRYLAAVEKGIAYCLRAQNAKGGWPQYFPDKSIYRAQITYNDNAMVNVLNILADILEGKNGFEKINPVFVPASEMAIKKAIDCIINTQIKVNGTLTAWCTQYNPITLVPEMARKFELASISANESVGIVRFLMRQKQPSDAIKNAIHTAIEWFQKARIKGYSYQDIISPDQPKGKDRVLVADANASVWSRFYEIETNRPLFSGRDSQKKYDVKEIEWERRTGYAWYGVWPENLISKDYPKWKKLNENL
ncbi:MAG: pectate lyase [Bacteroidetes bacterium 24-39-8]|nr:MAG: pectate lyase [Bacteroidetes bacterium 24-39-8]HQS53874.1 pectate lyase [Sediminibacterium sp.]